MFWVTTVDWFFLIRFVYSTYVVGSEVRLREVKTEPSSVFFGSPFGSVQNGSNTGLVSIAITLKPAAAGVRNSDAWLVVVFYQNHFLHDCRGFVLIDSTRTWSTEKKSWSTSISLLQNGHSQNLTDNFKFIVQAVSGNAVSRNRINN